MIERYSRPEMSLLWESSQRFNYMLQVEIQVALAQAQLGLIPKSAALAIKKKARVNVAEILELEKITKHDVIAFVQQTAKTVGPHGKYIHFGLTSSDVLDTALSLQIRDASRLVLGEIALLKKQLQGLVRQHAMTLCLGRTHGIIAEPTTFGFKMAGFLEELKRCETRFEAAVQQMAVCKLSGAVGTFSSQDIRVEKRVSQALNLTPEPVATQVIPRDRHAQVLLSLSQLGGFLERLSIELRHLQRSEVSEVEEGFTKGQKGSSAMPHKKNPISAENISGLSRLLKTYGSTALDNTALWHERDISHSSVERVIFPDAFILSDYLLHRMRVLLSGLNIKKDRMIQNLESSRGLVFSSLVLSALVKAGMSRDEAYNLIQFQSHHLPPDGNLKVALIKEGQALKYLSMRRLDEIFSGDALVKSISNLLKKRVKK